MGVAYFYYLLWQQGFIIDSRVKGIGNSIKLNQHLLYHACLGISHLKGVKLKVKKKVRKKRNWKQEMVSTIHL